MAKKGKFPQVIYVAKEQDNDGIEYFVAQDDPALFAEVNNIIPLGVYKLVEVKHVTAQAELE